LGLSRFHACFSIPARRPQLFKHPRWALGFNRGVPWKLSVSEVQFNGPKNPASAYRSIHYRLGPITVSHWVYPQPNADGENQR
jgi:hypothetical protein